MTTLRDRFPWTAATARLLWIDARRRRRVLVLFALAVLLFLALHAGVSAWTARRLSAAADGIVARRGSLELTSVAGPERISNANNRAKALRAATDLVVLDEEPPGPQADTAVIGRLGQFDAGQPDEESWNRSAAILEKNALALALLDEAARRSGSNWEIPYREGVSVRLPPLLGLAQVSKLNVAAGRLELRRGHPDAAVAIALRGFVIVESLRDEPILLVQLIRGSVLRSHLGLVREILASRALDDERLAALSAAVEGIEVRGPLEESVVWEMRAMRDALLTADFGRVPEGDGPWITLTALRWLLRPVIQENLRHYIVAMDGFASRTGLPPHRRDAAGAPALQDDGGWLHFLSRIAMVEDESVVDRGDVWDAARTLALTALALERWSRDRGTYPERLEQLVPGALDALPVDPFTGELPRYERTDSGFTLSSAGADVEARAFPGSTRVLRWEKRATAS